MAAVRNDESNEDVVGREACARLALWKVVRCGGMMAQDGTQPLVAHHVIRLMDHAGVLFACMALECFFFLPGSLLSETGLAALLLCAAVARYIHPHFIRLCLVAVLLWGPLARIVSSTHLAGLLLALGAVAWHLVQDWCQGQDHLVVHAGFLDPSRPTALVPFGSLQQPASVSCSWVTCLGEHDGVSGVRSVLADLHEQQQAHPAVSFEVILVLNGLRDRTGRQIGERLAGHRNLLVLPLARKTTLGRALRQGALRARGEWVVLVKKLGHVTPLMSLQALLPDARKRTVQENGSDAILVICGGGDAAARPHALQPLQKLFVRAALAGLLPPHAAPAPSFAPIITPLSPPNNTQPLSPPSSHPPAVPSVGVLPSASLVLSRSAAELVLPRCASVLLPFQVECLILSFSLGVKPLHATGLTLAEQAQDMEAIRARLGSQ